MYLEVHVSEEAVSILMQVSGSHFAFTSGNQQNSLANW